MTGAAPGSGQICLSLLPDRLAVCRLAPSAMLPTWAKSENLLALVSTVDELSVVCDEDCVPDGVQAESGWRAWKVRGPLDFTLTGVLSGIASALAKAQVSIFAISTYDTDYILIKENDLSRSQNALLKSGYMILESGDA